MSAQSSLDKYIKGRRQKNSVQLYRILKEKVKLWLCQVKRPTAAKICKKTQEKKIPFHSSETIIYTHKTTKLSRDPQCPSWR
jgi:hypothetical protein